MEVDRKKMDRVYCICWGCEHACYNNDDRDLIGGCRAFPDGIPSDEIGDIYSHDKPLEWQKNDFVYMPAKRNVSRLHCKIEVYQDFNPYADENGRYNMAF